jgi:chromosome segregation ATPase
MQQSSPPMQHLQLSTERHIGGTSSSSSSGVTLMEVSAFMAEQLKEQVKELRDHDERVRQDAKVEVDKLREEAAEARGRADMQAKVEAQREEITTMREEAAEARGRADMQAKVEAQRAGATAAKLHEQQLLALQNRLEALSAAKLLTDDELYLVEDIIADAAEPAEDDRLAMLLALSTRMTGDGAFARQLRRKVTS